MALLMYRYKETPYPNYPVNRHLLSPTVIYAELTGKPEQQVFSWDTVSFTRMKWDMPFPLKTPIL